jgi:ribose transport system substrate-binding protein
MKKFLALALAMVMLLGMSTAFAEKQFYIGYCNMFLTEDFFITVSNGLHKAAEANNVKFEENIAQRDAVVMTQIIETYITKGVDMVIDFNVLAETGSAMAAKLKEKGIPMISIDCQYEGAYFFGVNNYGAGEILGEAAVAQAQKKFGDSIDYIVSLYDSTSGDVIKSRCDGVVDKLVAAYKTPAENVIWLDCLADDIKTGTLTRDWLNSHPDAHKVVFIGQNDDRGFAINNVVETEGRKADCIIVSHNADPSAIENLKAHRDGDTAWVATASYNSHLYGEQVMNMALRILKGEPAEQSEYTKVTIVTVDNLDEYLATLPVK